MRVVVTGGAGFIGAHVVDALVDAAHDVCVIDIRPPNRADVEHSSVDLGDLDGLVRATKGADVVFHLAAVADVNDATAAPVQAIDLNITGTARVWEACRINNVRRAILASTVWVYSGAVGDGPVAENSSFSPEHAGHIYTSSKLAAEMVVHSYHTLYGQEFTILRYGIPYGPGMRDSLVIAKFVRMALANIPITIEGDGSQCRNYVYVEDLAAAHVLALRDEAACEVFNVEGRESVSIRRLVDSIGASLDRALSVEYRPSRTGDYSGREVSTEKAERVLGWVPRVPFDDGLRRYIDWHLSARDAPAPPAVVTKRERRVPILAGLGLALVALPALYVSRAASLDDRLFALAGSVTAGAVAWLTSRRSARFVPSAITAVLLLTLVWLLSQTGPGMISILLGALLGGSFGTSLAAPAVHETATLRYAAAVAGALGIVAAVARPALLWSGALLALLACSGNVFARASMLLRGRRVSWTMAGAAVVVTAITASWIGATSPSAAWFGSVVTHGSRQSQRVAITFDAATDSGQTNRILQILDARRTHVTFFESSTVVEKRPALAHAIAASGDLLASGAEAKGGSWLDPRYRELPRSRRAFAREIGVCPSFFRPPNGRHTPLMARVARRQGMTMVTWDVRASADSAGTPRQIANRLLGEIRPGSIVALHLSDEDDPTGRLIVAALPYVLDGLRARGLDPVRLDVLLNSHGYRSCSRPDHAAS